MLPKKELNIYSKSDENITELVSYFFDVDLSESLEFLKQQTSVSLNQMEFVLRKISEAYPSVFEPNLIGVIKLTNLLTYGFEALTVNEKDWTGSKPRINITRAFRDFVLKIEIDNNYLEKDN